MRKVNTRLYVVAGVITVVVFVLGLLLGIVIENERVNVIKSREREHTINFDSLQLQYLYISSLLERNGSCPAISTSLNRYINATEKSRMELESYIDKNIMHGNEFELLKREYMIAQLNYWIMSKKTKAICGSDFVTVLYFHSKRCDRCDDQGFVLDYFKKMLGDRLLVFTIDAEFSVEPNIPLLVDTYNITQMPTLIIDEKKFEGFQSKDALMDELCSRYREKPERCIK